jgi:hypothetical protein
MFQEAGPEGVFDVVVYRDCIVGEGAKLCQLLPRKRLLVAAKIDCESLHYEVQCGPAVLLGFGHVVRGAFFCEARKDF